MQTSREIGIMHDRMLDQAVEDHYAGEDAEDQDDN